jgi:hypothetical protein
VTRSNRLATRALATITLTVILSDWAHAATITLVKTATEKIATAAAKLSSAIDKACGGDDKVCGGDLTNEESSASTA